IDRRAYISAVYQGGAVPGVSLLPRPYGVWGIPDADLRALPGRGDTGAEQAKAKTLLAEAGFGPDRPLKIAMLTRALPAFTDLASFVISELKRVGVDASVRQVDSTQWFPLQPRGDFEVGTDRTSLGPDDPHAHFYRNFACQSPTNYAGYCNEEIARLIDQQSQEPDPKKRLALVQQIETRLEQAAIRPVLGWRLDYFAVWPYVRNLVPHHSIYGWGRMQ